MSIPLPPLPRPDAVTEIYTGHGYKDVWTAATVRARDQEIVRCVLQANLLLSANQSDNPITDMKERK